MAFPSNPSNGDVYTRFGKTYYYNSTSGVWDVFRASSSAPAVAVYYYPVDNKRYVATAGQTTFSVAYDTTNGGFVEAYVNGVKIDSSLFTANNDTSITFSNTLAEGDVVELLGHTGVSSYTVQPAASITTYATIDDLPLSGNDTADQAFVTGSNRLYLWNGTGWYNIALINTNPSISSGYSSSYSFATDGTPIEITLVGTDPEGVPLTWSYEVTTGSLTNGGGATATVSQEGNVFTITPTTTQAYAGAFSITWKASDGINLATAVSEFTLAFAIPFGQAEFTTAGTYSWTAPDGVTKVCVVCIGGGGGGSGSGTTSREGGGAGGGLGWKNDISVIPGNSYTVVVGEGAALGAAGGDSYFIDTSTVAGFGGGAGIVTSSVRAVGGGYVGDGGGNGGDGGLYTGLGYNNNGGAGGAGGYSGNGGRGGDISGSYPNAQVVGNGLAGSGGGGGGGGSGQTAGAGGGVSIYGEGSSGAGGTGVQDGVANPGYGGSSGTNGTKYVFSGGVGYPPHGGAFGGGTPGGRYNDNAVAGSGAVRIIYGDGRAFPSTLTVDLDSNGDPI